MLGGNDCFVSELDQQLSASVKKILLERIAFKEAQIPDKGDMLNLKYKPLNSGYKPGMSMKSKDQNNSAIVASDDVPKPPVTLFQEHHIENDWKDIRRIGPGLANLGNTCFLNSVLQVLTYTPPLVNYIFTQQHKSKCKSVGFCMQCELTNHFLRVVRHNPQSGGAVRPMSIIQKLQCIGKNFRFGRQEDAHEFLRFVVEAIQKSDYAGKPNLDKLSKETTVANAIFGGFYRSQVKCLQCQYESNTFDPMMDMNLDIKDCSSIIQALQKSVRPDRLDGDNKYFCERCRVKRTAQKRGTIHKTPNVLTLQLKRFDFSKMFGGKISKDISFPEDLNIRPYMSQPKGDPVLYKLYGVLVHSGYSCNSGHYYCYVRAPNGTWYEMNDNRVCQVGFQTVRNAQAYLLFYVKKTTPKKKQQQDNTIISQTKTKVENNITPATNKLQSSYSTSSNSLNLLGMPVQRKSEPKIVWNTNNKSEAPSSASASVETKAESLLKQKAIKLSSYTPFTLSNNSKKESTNNVLKSETKPLLGDKKDSFKAKAPKKDLNDLKDSILTKKEPKVSSLQRISISYDTDSPSSSAAPSPKSNTPDEDQKLSIVIDTGHSSAKRTNLTLSLSPTDSNNSGEARKASPVRVKLSNGKCYSNSGKFNVWSPVTKGILHPRVIINKSLADPIAYEKSSSTVNDPKKHSSGKENIIQAVKRSSPDHENDKSIKETSDKKIFGPVMPSYLTTNKRNRNDSINSETSSTGSIHSQSGEWDIFEKRKQNTLNKQNLLIVPERQHAGWKVIRNGHNSKHKHDADKKVHHNEASSQHDSPSSTHQESRKRKYVDCFPSQEKGKYFEVTVENDKRLSNDNETENSPKKKKKKDKKKHKKEKHHTLEVLHSSFLPCSAGDDALEEGSDVTSKKKKKRKKHKKKHKRQHSSDSDSGRDENRERKHSLDYQKAAHETHKVKLPNNHSASTLDTHIHKKHMKYSKTDTSIKNTGIKKHEKSNSSSRDHSPSSHVSRQHTYDISTDTSHQKKKLAHRDSNKHSQEYDLTPDAHRKKKEKRSSTHSSRNTSPEPHKKKSSKVSSHRHKNHSTDDERDSDDTYEKKDEDKHRKKKDVPCHVWDDTKKKVNTWTGCTKTDALKYLMAGGAQVSSWDGDQDNSGVYSVKNREDGEQAQDEYDEEYDKGKVKKFKMKHDGEERKTYGKLNPFQDLQDYRNYTKDNHATHRSPAKHHKHQHRHHEKPRFKSR